ncbi:MAG: SUF system NifU family Fe-S cluster assembly protein [Planctomycetaceae bacterium]
MLDHMQAPYHRGRLQTFSAKHASRNPFCGDRIELQLLIDEKSRITEAWHDGKGCMTSLAAASILCEFLEGHSLDNLLSFSKEQMLDLLGVQLTPLRQQCALVALNALKEILSSQAEERDSQCKSGL